MSDSSGCMGDPFRVSEATSPGHMSNPVGAKIYLQPEGMVFETIADLAEMQGAKMTLSKINKGKISFIVNLYGAKREYRFSITNIERKRCHVRLEIDDLELDKPGKEIMIRRQFALLDSMLVINVETMFEKQEDVIDENK